MTRRSGFKIDFLYMMCSGSNLVTFAFTYESIKITNFSSLISAWKYVFMSSNNQSSFFLFGCCGGNSMEICFQQFHSLRFAHCWRFKNSFRLLRVKQFYECILPRSLENFLITFNIKKYGRIYYMHIHTHTHIHTNAHAHTLINGLWSKNNGATSSRHKVVADVIFFCGIVLFTDAHNTKVRNIIRCFCLNEKCMPEVFVLMGISQNKPRI